MGGVDIDGCRVFGVGVDESVASLAGIVVVVVIECLSLGLCLFRRISGNADILRARVRGGVGVLVGGGVGGIAAAAHKVVFWIGVVGVFTGDGVGGIAASSWKYIIETLDKLMQMK